MSAQSTIFSAGTINRTTLTLVANNTNYKWVISFLHLVRNTEGTPPILSLTLVRGNSNVRLLPINYKVLEGVDVLEGYQTITLQPHERIEATIDTINSVDYTITGESHPIPA